VADVTPHPYRRAPLDAKAEPGRVAHGAQLAGRVVLERALVQRTHPFRVQVGDPAMEVGHGAEIGGRQRRSHGVDGEVSPG